MGEGARIGTAEAIPVMLQFELDRECAPNSRTSPVYAGSGAAIMAGCGADDGNGCGGGGGVDDGSGGTVGPKLLGTAISIAALAAKVEDICGAYGL